MKCPLCGYEFEAVEGVSACHACPLALRCTLVRCPRCSYEWPPTKLPKGLKKRRKKHAKT